MTDHSLRHCRILVVEDEYMLADDLRYELQDAGSIVLGPVGTVADAIDLITSIDPIAETSRIDGALLDTNLGGEMVFPVADLLIERGVPIVFTTGYDLSAMPPRYAVYPRCEKPISMKKVIQTIGRVIHA